MERAVKMARTTNHSESLAWALLGKCEVSQKLSAGKQACAAAEELFSICEENGLMMQPALAKGFYGWALAVEGDPKLGTSVIRDAFRTFSALGSALSETHGHVLLAEAYWYAGDAEKGLLSFEEPLTVTKSEERNFAAELCRVRGELLLLRTRTKGFDAETESLFRQAILVAQKQSAKSLELRATMSLARLLRDTSRRDEARTMLADIYNWFTEGFDTADLKDAKTLLDELST